VHRIPNLGIILLHGKKVFLWIFSQLVKKSPSYYGSQGPLRYHKVLPLDPILSHLSSHYALRYHSFKIF